MRDLLEAPSSESRPKYAPSASAAAGARPLRAHSGSRVTVHGVRRLPSSITDPLRHSGVLENRWTAVAVLFAAVLLAAGWAVAARRGKRHGRRQPHPVLLRSMLGGTLAALLIAGALLAVNSYVGYAPDTGALAGLLSGRPSTIAGAAGLTTGVRGEPASPGGRSKSRVVRLTVGASRLGVPPLPVYAYLPPGYDSHPPERYPTVYLIHGYPGAAPDWLRAGQAQRTMDLLVAQHLVRPMILVFPDASGGRWLHDSECLNAIGGQQMETYLARTVVDAVDAQLRTIPDRADRAIGGLSSGGYCALNLGLRHQGMFSVILASEPYGDPGWHAGRLALHGNRALYDQNSPSSYISWIRFAYPMATFLDAGTADPHAVRVAAAMARMLASRGQYAAFRLAPGYGHTWLEARAELPYCLVFASNHFRLRMGGHPVRPVSHR